MEISVTLKFAKETPGTYRYDNEDRDSPIQSIYIKKSGISGTPPQVISVEVKD